MWRTLNGARIFVAEGGFGRLVPELKKTGRLWRAVSRSYRGSLRGAVMQVLGVLARRAEDKGLWQGADGLQYRVFETHFAGDNYDLWARPSGGLVAIRHHSADGQYEFEGEPGPSANNVHEQTIGYLNGLFSNAGFEVRVDKDLGRMVDGTWQTISDPDRKTGNVKLRPDLQVTDKKTNRTYYIEVDSDPKSGAKHLDDIRTYIKDAPVTLISYNHGAGKPDFTTNFIGGQLGPSNIAKIVKHMDGQKWPVIDIFAAMQQAMKGQQGSQPVRKVQPRKQPLVKRLGNRPPNISGAVRRTPRGGRHREHEFFSELAV